MILPVFYLVYYISFIKTEQCKKSLAAQRPGCYAQVDNEKENNITCDKFLFTT